MLTYKRWIVRIVHNHGLKDEELDIIGPFDSIKEAAAHISANFDDSNCTIVQANNPPIVNVVLTNLGGSNA